MNRTLKEATVKRFYYETRDQLRSHLADFVTASTSPSGSRPSKDSPPTNTSASCGQKEPQRFTRDPLHQMPGLNI